MLKHKSNLLHIFVILYFIIYVSALALEKSDLGLLLSPVGPLISASILFYVHKKATRVRHIWLGMGLACLSYGVGDVAWAVAELVFGIDPNTLALLNFIYLFSNLFILLAGIAFIKRYYRTMSFIQLCLDALAISLGCSFNFWVIVIHRDLSVFSADYNSMVIGLYMLTDFIAITLVILWLFSNSRRGGTTRSIYLAILGAGVFFITDLYYSYLSMNNLYSRNMLIDAIYVFSLFCMAYGGLLGLKANSEEWANRYYAADDSGRAQSRGHYLLLFLIPLFIHEGFVLTHVILFVLGFLIHQVFSSYIQNNDRNEKLLLLEKEMTSLLESKVAERTKQLTEANKELEYISYYDNVTNAWNNRYFRRELERRIATADETTPIAVFCLDLDRFKNINDSYGHDTGDRVLVELSKRFNQWNQIDAVLARLSGDEFSLIISGRYSRDELETLAKGLIACADEPIQIGQNLFKVTVSMGIAIYPEHGQDRTTLMKNADVAMYHSKGKGFNHYSFFEVSMIEHILKRQEIEMLLHQADFNQEFELVYQPQIAITSEKLIGIEALIRWHSPTKGLIMPNEFIGIAEEAGIIIPIGDWVLETALRQVSEWNRRYNLNLKIGINVSPKQLDDLEFIPKLKRIIEKYQVLPQWIDLEITESIAMKGEQTINEIFNTLADMNISTSIDDFGTGYSSLGYIQKFSFDKLKIAKPLIDPISHETNSRQVVDAIIKMSKALNVATIAEGVEDIEQLHILKQLGCDDIQGYVFSKPVTAREIEENYLS